MPEVSVIIPYYKKISHINNAIDSVLNQTFTDFEIILDNSEILSEMVDSIINEVGVNNDITENLLSYSFYKISDRLN